MITSKFTTIRAPILALFAGCHCISVHLSFHFRLLKEKQDHEERSKSATPPILSPSPSSVKSPPPVVQQEPEQQQPPNEVIGAGLPLLQRLLLLKSKEEHAQQQQQPPPTSPTPTAVSPPPSKSANQKTLKPSKLSLRELLKLQKDNNKTEEQKPIEEKSESGEEEKPWSKLKKAAIVRDSDPSTSTTSVSDVKPKLVLTRKTKHYRSIDDLSPEYGGLPFVKKLKILNERQKLEELETVMKTRSFSLDIPDQQQLLEADTLTRSHSEGSTMHQHNRDLLSVQLCPSPLHSSTESNETLERRNLKSILKKLSEDGTNLPAAMPPKIDSTEFRKLMRAPTIEGYAARHSKLVKSVTFNRDTLQSPPNSANLTVGTTPNLFQLGNGVGIGEEEEEEKRQELEKCGIQLISAKNQVKLHKGESGFCSIKH